MRVLISCLYSETVAIDTFILFTATHMKKKAFITGAIAGTTALIIAVPVLSQFADAQQASSVSSQAQVSSSTASVVSDAKVDAKLGGHVGADGRREEILTGDNAAKATAAALVAVPGGTIDRVETDTEGDVYEAHMTASDGSRVTVKFDANFNVTKIEEGHMKK